MKLIAEIGFNHEGNQDIAQQMISAAADAGADAVKFQTYKAGDIVLPHSPHFEAIKCGEMDLGQHQELARMADDCGVEFLSTPFSLEAVDLLEEVGVAAYKIASMDCTNGPLLDRVAATGKPIYLSTGMATLAEIECSIDRIRQHSSAELTLMHCISKYPPQADELNLDVIPLLQRTFDLPVGYSDHYPGYTACLAAYMLGAEVIETHFTLDTGLPGADHGHSADAEALGKLRRESELFSRMKGSARSIFDRPDRDVAEQFRRGIYSARSIQRDQTIRAEDLLMTRPENNLSPNHFDQIIGKKTSVTIEPLTPLSPLHLR